MKPRISICIATHNQGHLLTEAIESCLLQDYENFDIIVLDDASTDGTDRLLITHNEKVKYYHSNTPSGSGGAFNKAIEHAKGEYVVLLCADDLFTDHRVLSDIADRFEMVPGCVHVSRYYHQFIDGDRAPVRAWRCNDIIELANNPSGLAFRRSAIGECQLSNKMFVEAPSLVSCVMAKAGSWATTIQWDTVAVRIHQSTARSHSYYRKMWTSSPVEEWSKVGGKALQRDFTSLIQIKNYFTTQAVLKECWKFIKLRPMNLLAPGFWFFSLTAVLTPRPILMRLPDLYRRTFGKWTTKEVKRP